MNIISIKDNPEYASVAIEYFQDKLASEESIKLYEIKKSYEVDKNYFIGLYLGSRYFF
ncbi:MAG: hypothetical protein ACRCXA_06555 [Peptostreptococcaceae bacterium]